MRLCICIGSLSFSLYPNIDSQCTAVFSASFYSDTYPTFQHTSNQVFKQQIAVTAHCHRIYGSLFGLWLLFSVSFKRQSLSFIILSLCGRADSESETHERTQLKESATNTQIERFRSADVNSVSEHTVYGGTRTQPNRSLFLCAHTYIHTCSSLSNILRNNR